MVHEQISIEEEVVQIIVEIQLTKKPKRKLKQGTLMNRAAVKASPTRSNHSSNSSSDSSVLSTLAHHY